MFESDCEFFWSHIQCLVAERRSQTFFTCRNFWIQRLHEFELAKSHSLRKRLCYGLTKGNFEKNFFSEVIQ